MWTFASEHPYLFAALWTLTVVLGPREIVRTVRLIVTAFRAPQEPRP